VKLVMSAQGVTSGPLWDRASQSILGLEGETHHRLRRLVSMAFTPRGAERLRTLIVDVITELVDPLAAVGHCDVVADIARRYPTPIICALLGAPRQDWQLFSAWTDEIKKIFDWNVASDGPVIEAAWAELDAYLEEMLAQRRENLTDDLISVTGSAAANFSCWPPLCSLLVPTPLATNWRQRFTSCIDVPTSGHC
jgi:cytochrome P450